MSSTVVDAGGSSGGFLVGGGSREREPAPNNRVCGLDGRVVSGVSQARQGLIWRGTQGLFLGVQKQFSFVPPHWSHKNSSIVLGRFFVHEQLVQYNLPHWWQSFLHEHNSIQQHELSLLQSEQ